MSWFSRWRGLEWDPLFGATWLSVLLMVVVAAYAVHLYRRTDAPLGGGLRVLLPALRAGALAILVILLARPVLSLALPGGASRGVLVLADRSSSLILPGRAAGEERETELRRALTAIEQELSGGYPLTTRPFSGAVGAPLEPGAVLEPPLGEATDIAAAIEGGVAAGGPQGRPGAILLVSDGTATTGSDPVSAARRAGLPVEVVALGSSEPVPDLAVSRVRANVEAFAGERTPVEALLRLQGLAGAAVTVDLVDVTDAGETAGEATVAQTTVRLEPGGAETKVSLSFVPARIGLRFFEVRVPVLDGEVSTPNNRRIVALDIREEKTGILLLTGSLTWDHTFIRRALDADSTLGIHAGLRRGNAFTAVGDSRALPRLDAAGFRGTRVVILDHVRASTLERSSLEAVAGFVRGGGGLILLSGGRAGDLSQWKETPLGSLLPLEPGGNGLEAETPVRLSAAARRHTLFDPTAPGAASLEDWKDLPPLAVTPDAGPLRAGGEALVLSFARDLPVISWSPAGQGRVLVIAAGGLWRWQFMSAALGPGATLLPAWWRRAVHWLAQPSLEGQVDIRPEKPVVPRGERVSFVARVNDAEYRPVPGASVELSVTPAGADTSGGTHRLTLSGAEGVLTGGTDPLPPGRYRFEGRARTPQAELPSVQGTFVVDSVGVEMERLEADHELLERVATVSGGRVWNPDSLSGLDDALALRAAADEERVQLALWDHPFFFIVFVSLLSLEWFLRRRRGLV